MIQIGMGPNLLASSLFVISWHGFLSFVAVALAVFLVVRWSSRGDLHLAKLEKELEEAVKRVSRRASQHFLGGGESGAPPQAPPEDLQEMLVTLKAESNARITVMDRDGKVIAASEDDQQGADLPFARRDFQGVLGGQTIREVRALRGQEHLVVWYPVYVERVVAEAVQIPGGSGEANEEVLVDRVKRTVEGIVRLVVPTAQARTRSLDAIYGVAIWGIVGGVVGSRVVHVIDEWRFYGDHPGQIIAIWNGGIGLWGAIVGGILAGVVAARFYKMPLGKLADLAALSMLPAQAVGRVGDIINGEHISKVTNVPWGFVWSHPDSPTYRSYGLAATHPAVVYEMIWDLLLFVVLWRFVYGRLKPDGMIMVAYLAFYSFGRYFISFYRVDRIWFAGLQEAQVIALGLILVTVPLLAFRARFVSRESAESPRAMETPAPAGRP